MSADEVGEEEETPMEEETPRKNRRKPPPRTKSLGDAGALATMRKGRRPAPRGESEGSGGGDNEENNGNDAAADGEDGKDARGPPRRRRAPGRTKSSDDMASMGRMTRYARQKSKEDNVITKAPSGKGEAEKAAA